MAVVSQNVSATQTYSPFEGMSERRRLANSVPRGLVRFDLNTALTAKPVNDSYDLQITCPLPSGFAYVVSALSFRIAVDTATDFDAVAQGRIFNGLPQVTIVNTQYCAFAMSNVPDLVANDPQRILNYELGSLREWFPNPVVKNPVLAASSFILNYHNSAAAVQAAGIIRFHFNAYQYELNQAVRFPLNSPVPVGIR